MTREIHGKTTVPLNGWRTRRLALYYFGTSEAEGKFIEGYRFLVPAHVLQELPEFDSKNQAYVNSFEGSVVCEVEYEDRSYGIHISIEPAPTLYQMNAELRWGRWADYIRAEIKGNVINVYWKDIRPEDFIMNLRTESIMHAGLLIDEKNLCQGYWCSNDLVYRIIQIHGAEIQAKIEKAGVL